jgi:type IX secretion system PorP/SprF family membrane protein
MTFKKTALRRILTYILPLLISVRAYAQDPQFSQFYANPINTNPAFAGSSTVGRLVMNTRNQWPGISGSFTTANASYDEHFEAINGGIGIQAHFDEQGTGTLRTVGANMAYSYLIPVSRKFTIRLAIQAGFMQKSVDFTKFLWRNQLGTNGYNGLPGEPLGTPEGKANIINFAAGFLGYSKNFYFGFAAHNLTQPDQSFNLYNKAIVAPIYRRFTGHVGFIYPINESRIKSRSSYLYPNVIYMQQFFNGQQAAQLNLGMYISKGSLVGGLYMRQTNSNTDAVIAIIGIRTEKVKIGFSYDGTVSIANAGAASSYEVSLAFELRKKVRRRNPRPMTCPDF